MPMASWGCCLEPLEKLESHLLLELKALCEGAWKIGEFAAFSQHLIMQVTLEPFALLKVTTKAYPELQAMLIGIHQYKPTWVVEGTSAMPKELDFTSSTMGEWEDKPEDPVGLDTMHCTESTLGKVSLPLKACFIPGKAGAYAASTAYPRKWHAMGGFIILDVDGVEVLLVWMILWLLDEPTLKG